MSFIILKIKIMFVTHTIQVMEYFRESDSEQKLWQY